MFPNVGQAGLELLTSGYLPTAFQRAGIIGASPSFGTNHVLGGCLFTETGINEDSNISPIYPRLLSVTCFLWDKVRWAESNLSNPSTNDLLIALGRLTGQTHVCEGHFHHSIPLFSCSLFFICAWFYFIFETESHSVTQAGVWLTATSASQVQAILLLQPPE